MIPQIDITLLSPPAQKLAGPGAPEKMKEMAAKGVMPGIRPGEVVAILVLLRQSEVESIATTAAKTLAKLPEQLLAGALATDLQAMAIDALALTFVDNRDVLEKLLAMPQIHMETVEGVAKHGSEAVTELIATNEDRLLNNPKIIEQLYLNKHTRMSTADRLIDLAARNNVVLTGIPAFREAAQALQGELIPEPSDEPTPDDLLFQETQALAEALAAEGLEDTHVEDEEGNEHLQDKAKPLHARIADMTMSQKVRRASLGTREELMLLVRDSNKVVASAAIRSPKMQENEVMLISRNRNMPDEVLRIISSSPEWMKSYQIKRNLVENPKCPAAQAQRIITHLRESDLRYLAKSKNVTGSVRDAARRHLERRKS